MVLNAPLDVIGSLEAHNHYHTHAHTHAHMHTCMRTYICVPHTHTCMHTYALTNTCINTHMHTYTMHIRSVCRINIIAIIISTIVHYHTYSKPMVTNIFHDSLFCSQ